MIVPSVFIAPYAMEKMQLWARMAGEKKREYICFGTADYLDWLDGYYIDEVYLVKQEGSSSSIEADDKDMADLTYRLFSEGIDPARLRAWIHSHPGTGPSATYLSCTDEDMVDRWLNGDFLISIVWDSKGENPFCRVDLKRPRVNFETEIELCALGQDEWEDAVNEFKEKSKPKSYTTFKGGAYIGKSYKNQHGKYVNGKWIPWKELDKAEEGSKNSKSGKKGKSKNASKKIKMDDWEGIEMWGDMEEDWDPVAVAGKLNGDLTIGNGYNADDFGAIKINMDDYEDDFDETVTVLPESQVEKGKLALQKEINEIIISCQMGQISAEDAVEFMQALGFDKEESMAYVRSELEG